MSAVDTPGPLVTAAVASCLGGACLMAVVDRYLLMTPAGSGGGGGGGGGAARVAATTKWRGDNIFETTVGPEGHKVVIEPGPGGKHAAPMQVLLSAAAACTGTGLLGKFKKAGIQVVSLEIEMSAGTFSVAIPSPCVYLILLLLLLLLAARCSEREAGVRPTSISFHSGRHGVYRAGAWGELRCRRSDLPRSSVQRGRKHAWRYQVPQENAPERQLAVAYPIARNDSAPACSRGGQIQL